MTTSRLLLATVLLLKIAAILGLGLIVATELLL
jgi:hypothetical protein